MDKREERCLSKLGTPALAAVMAGALAAGLFALAPTAGGAGTRGLSQVTPGVLSSSVAQAAEALPANAGVAMPSAAVGPVLGDTAAGRQTLANVVGDAQLTSATYSVTSIGTSTAITCDFDSYVMAGAESKSGPYSLVEFTSESGV